MECNAAFKKASRFQVKLRLDIFILFVFRNFVAVVKKPLFVKSSSNPVSCFQLSHCYYIGLCVHGFNELETQ